MRGLIAEAGELWAVELGLQFDIRNLEAEDFLNNYTLKFAQKVSQTTSNEITLVLQQAMAEGWSVPTAQNRLGDLFRQWMHGNVSAQDFAWMQARLPDYRLEMIVRSETIRAYGAGTRELFRRYGILRRRWWAALDERTCPWCFDMHGKTISVEENWYNLGDVIEVRNGDKVQRMTVNYTDIGHPPLHTSCRCAEIADI